MSRVLVVHHDIDLADQEVDALRRRGYEATQCMGPIGAQCPILSGRTCDLAENADVLVYDAWVTGDLHRLVPEAEVVHARRLEKKAIRLLRHCLDGAA